MNWLTGLFGGGARASEPEHRPRGTPLVRPEAEPRRSGLPRFDRGGFGSRAGGNDELQRVRLRLREAFTPSQPVLDERMFAGREALLATLIRAIEDQRMHVVLFGDRGMGKTSMLHVLARQAEEAHYLVAYSSCGETSDFGDTFRSILAEVPLLYHSGYSPTDVAIEGGQTMADLLPATAPVRPRDVSAVLGKLTGTRLLIVLDEFDRSPPGGFRREVAELIKTLSDRAIRVQLVIAGVAANLTELVEHIPSIRRNIAGIRVTGMATEEIEALIRLGERVSGLSYEDRAVQVIIVAATGSPYLASLLSQHAGLNALDRGELRVAARDVTEALVRAEAEVHDRLSERSRYEIKRVQNDGMAETLTELALAALRDNGRFTAATLAETMGRERADEVVSDLARRYGLIALADEDAGMIYHFREEGVPVFLWLSTARRRLATD